MLNYDLYSIIFKYILYNDISKFLLINKKIMYDNNISKILMSHKYNAFLYKQSTTISKYIDNEFIYYIINNKKNIPNHFINIIIQNFDTKILIYCFPSFLLYLDINYIVEYSCKYGKLDFIKFIYENNKNILSFSFVYKFERHSIDYIYQIALIYKHYHICDWISSHSWRYTN